MIISLYYFTNYLLDLAILVLPYIPDGPEVIITADTITIGTAAFSSILTRYFLNCRNRSSNYITWGSSNTFTI